MNYTNSVPVCQLGPGGGWLRRFPGHSTYTGTPESRKNRISTSKRSHLGPRFALETRIQKPIALRNCPGIGGPS